MKKGERDPLKVLVVDDSLSDVLLLRESLSGHARNISLEVFHDGALALDSLQTGRAPGRLPDIIILDLNLPRVDGFEILTALKGDSLTRPIPVLVMSCSDAESDVSRAYSLGANAYLVKPISLGETMNSIRAMAEFWFHTARLIRPAPRVRQSSVRAAF